jgi:hypothetical protein
MHNFLTFSEIKDRVEQDYPTPLASVFRRYRLLNRQDLGGRHKGIVDLFEVFVRLLCILQLQSARTSLKDFINLLPQKEKDLQFLKRPSLGGWIGLIRALSSIDKAVSDSEFLSRVAFWFKQENNDQSRMVFNWLSMIGVIQYNRRSRTPHAEICNALVNYRNKQLAHAANLGQDELERRLPILESILAFLIQSANFLSESRFFFTDRIEDAGGGKWKIHATKLRGYSPEPEEIVSRPKLEKSEIYCMTSVEAELQAKPVPLGPFIIWHYNEDKKKSESYFYNDAWRTKLEYLSFESGSYYYHKELKEGLRELVPLEIRPGPEDDLMGHLTQTEREIKADEFIKRASIQIQKGHLEDALELLELSAEYSRTTETLVKMAKVQRDIGDNTESVKQTLFQCLQEDPENKEANRILKELEIREYDGITESESDKDSFLLEHYPTSFHVISPFRNCRFGWTFWMLVVSIWTTGSAITELVFGRVQDGVGLFLGGLTAMLFALGPVLGLSKIIKLRLPLSLQLNSMRLHRFDIWFHQRMKDIFGNVVFKNGNINWKASILAEKWYYLLWVIHIIVFGGAAFMLTESYNESPFFMAKRIVDFFFVYLLWFPGLRYVVMSTIFIYKYSLLSLKPMLTVINDDGMRSFGPLMTYNLGLAVLFYVFYWPGAALMAQIEFKLDFFFLLLSSITFALWSVGMPLMIRRSARESKSRAVHVYSAHIEKAFNTLLEDPNKDRFDRYSWLQSHQKIISSIPTWPLSRKETIFVVLGSNVILLMVNVAYILYRTGALPHLTW